MEKENKSYNIEIHTCALCHDAICGNIYKNINPERIIRAIKFDNIKGARYLIGNEKTCLEIKTTAIPLTLDDGLKSLLLTDSKNV